jgi:hypothetical protein
MPIRALLYRRPTEPQALEIFFGRAVYLVRLRRHRQARRYTLRIHNATREVVLTMPPRGSLKEAQDFAQKHGGWIAARLHRLPEAAPFSHGTIVPLRGVPHRIVHRPGARGTVWAETNLHGERLLCVAGEAPHVDRRVSDYLKREARADLESASARGVDTRAAPQAADNTRPVQPLGIVFDDRGAVVFLAAYSGAAVRARLSGGA